MKKQNLYSKKNFYLNSKFWFWPFFAGGFFCLGYSITKNIFTEQSTHKQLNDVNKNLVFSDLEKNNEIKNIPTLAKTKLRKFIDFPTSDGSVLRLTINYSEIGSSKELAAFKNSSSFFRKENVESLMKTLKNTKQNKSPKVEVD